MEYKSLIYEPGKVTRIIFNRPRWKNAISHPMYAEIEHAFDRAAADPECRVLVVSGAGPCFSSGHDTIGGSPEGAPMMADGLPPEELRKQFATEKEMWRAYWIQHTWYTADMHTEKLFTFPKPSIAMVHGYAIFGGAHIAEMMDLIFATDDALFLGVGGGAELTHLSPRKILELSYEHRFVTGLEAQEFGMVNRTYPTFDDLERETLAYAHRVAENPVGQQILAKREHWARLAHQGFPGLVVESRRQVAWEMLNDKAIAGRLSIEGPNPEEANRQRYEGKGAARTPRAMANLKVALESQGRPVPEAVSAALERFGKQDPKAFWKKALHQPWRDPEGIARAEEQARIYEEHQAKVKGTNT